MPCSAMGVSDRVSVVSERCVSVLVVKVLAVG
jgi:hypothetical protein